MPAIRTLVIACGNPLRGDDGVAHVAADIVRAWNLPGVRVLTVHQLAPELIDDLKQADRVLFLDACMDTLSAAFDVRSVEPNKSRRLFGHHESPENLLALLQDLERQTPPAWLLAVRGASFEHGEGLSDATQQHLHEALEWLRTFLPAPPG